MKKIDLGDLVAGLALMSLAAFGFVAPVASEGCSNPPSPAVVKQDLTTALDLTQAACSVADTTGVAYVILGCAIATVLENGAVQISTLFVPVSASQAPALLAAHPESDQSKPLVALYKLAHPSAAVGPLR